MARSKKELKEGVEKRCSPKYRLKPLFENPPQLIFDLAKEKLAVFNYCVESTAKQYCEMLEDAARNDSSFCKFYDESIIEVNDIEDYIEMHYRTKKIKLQKEGNKVRKKEMKFSEGKNSVEKIDEEIRKLRKWKNEIRKDLWKKALKWVKENELFVYGKEYFDKGKSGYFFVGFNHFNLSQATGPQKFNLQSYDKQESVKDFETAWKNFVKGNTKKPGVQKRLNGKIKLIVYQDGGQNEMVDFFGQNTVRYSFGELGRRWDDKSLSSRQRKRERTVSVRIRISDHKGNQENLEFSGIFHHVSRGAKVRRIYLIYDFSKYRKKEWHLQFLFDQPIPYIQSEKKYDIASIDTCSLLDEETKRLLAYGIVKYIKNGNIKKEELLSFDVLRKWHISNLDDGFGEVRHNGISGNLNEVKEILEVHKILNLRLMGVSGVERLMREKFKDSCPGFLKTWKRKNFSLQREKSNLTLRFFRYRDEVHFNDALRIVRQVSSIVFNDNVKKIEKIKKFCIPNEIVSKRNNLVSIAAHAGFRDKLERACFRAQIPFEVCGK